jgi:hypothetical protein
MMEVTRHQIRLEWTHTDDECAEFVNPDRPDELYYMPLELWGEMDKPEEITLRVLPGEQFDPADPAKTIDVKPA